MLLVATFSFSFASCSKDDGPNKGDDISMAGKLNTVTAAAYENVTIDVGCTVHYSSAWGIRVEGGDIILAGDFQNLSSITTAPLDGYRSYASFYDDNCYIVKSYTGKFIRLKVKRTEDEKYEFQFQTYVPTNI